MRQATGHRRSFQTRVIEEGGDQLAGYANSASAVLFHSLSRSEIMKRMLVVLVALLCVVSLAAAQLPDGALAIHVSNVPVTSIPDCTVGLVTEWPGAYPNQLIYFHVVICGHMYMSPQNYGFAAAEYDLEIGGDGLGLLLDWESFSDAWIGYPGQGIIQVWADCERGLHPYVIGRATVLIMLPPVTASIVPHPESGLAQLVDCDYFPWQILPAPPGNGRAGWAIAGGYGGYNPCPCADPSPVEESTWGQIKSLYR
jgi:hypothetical protein